jgi:hypothetical protein
LAPLRILTKEGETVRFDSVWNYAQLAVIDETERQIVEVGRVRIITLKARQIGISTVIEAILFTFAVMNDDFSSLVLSHEKDSSEHLLSMSTRFNDTYVDGDHHVEKYKGKAHLAWSDCQSQMRVKTAKNEESGRSNTIHALHASEVAFWPTPDTIMTGLKPAIPKFGLTLIFIESTANGVGNYFHRMCMEAMRGDNEYAFMFFPWHKHPEYTAAFIPGEEAEKHSLDGVELTEEEQWLRDVMHIDDDRLIWRRYMIRNESAGDINKFHQEYPTTPHEAFISTGLHVFPLNECLVHYRPRRGRRGILRHNATTRAVEFVARSDGWLTIYSYPSSDQAWGVYLCGADPTHTLAGDNAVIQVLNRRTLEQVAVYRNKIKPIAFGKHCQLVGTFYNQAMIAAEREGPGYGTVGCIVADEYPNVYQPTNVVSAQGVPQDAFGWSTNVQTKGLAISHLTDHVTQPLSTVGDTTYGLIIHDELTLMEMRDYVTTDDGKKYTNSDGSEYDDGVMSMAIAVTVNDLEPSPAAYSAPSVHDMEVNLGVATQRVESAPPRHEDDDDDDLVDQMAPWELWSTPRQSM